MPPDWLLAVLDIAAIAAVAWLGGAVVQRMRQPRIAGEMAALFGAALLLDGRVADVVPGAAADGTIARLFPDAVITVVSAVGGLGLVLYMLLVGLTIDLAPMRGRAGAIAVLAGAAIGSMGVLALVAGPLLVDAGGWKPEDVGRTPFVLALAAALAASGVPIVARIVEDRGMQDSVTGALAIVATTAVTALALIGAAVAVEGGDAPAVARVGVRVAAGLTLLAGVFAAARARRFKPPPPLAWIAVVALAVASALVGDELLSSLLLGPLVVGVVVDKHGRTAEAIERVLGVVVRRVMLPVFLGLAALQTDLRALGSDALAPTLAIVTTVIAIRLTAGYGIARIAGFPPRDARVIAALMQCGGVMTIAISLAELEAGVIDARMHAALTVVGVVTTFVAGALVPPARGADRWSGLVVARPYPERGT